jgi:hypothetical protein
MRGKGGLTRLRKRPVVPDIPVVRETVSNVSQSTFFNILLDRVELLLLGDLHLGVGPARDFDDHVEDTLALVGEEGDVMEGRDGGAICFDVDAVF